MLGLIHVISLEDYVNILHSVVRKLMSSDQSYGDKFVSMKVFLDRSDKLMDTSLMSSSPTNLRDRAGAEDVLGEEKEGKSRIFDR